MLSVVIALLLRVLPRHNTSPACADGLGHSARCCTPCRDQAAAGKEGDNAAGGTTACCPSPRLPPAREVAGQFHTARASSTHKKTPTENGRGQPRQAAAPFPRKDVSAPCRAGLLARGMTLLSAPSQGQGPQWSLQISIRIQLRGSDGFTPSSLVIVTDYNQPY